MNDARRAAFYGEPAHEARLGDVPTVEIVTSYADEHENGQLRIAVPGEQVSLLPLPDSLIPSTQDEED